jgi:hypothetical protein
MTSFISFAHRRNRDSTVDSICTRCYQTIASGQSDSTLKSVEANHLCDSDAESDRQAEVSRLNHWSGGSL